MSTALKVLPPPQRLLTWDEYEKAELKSEVRHEFAAGRLYAMAGATRNHNRIALATASALHQLLRGKSCEAFIADMKLRIDVHQEQFGYYPDVMVVCDKSDRHPLHSTKPAVVFEVLSKSTERIDRREKLLAYRAVESLQAYVLIEQSQPQATIYRRAVNWGAETVSGPDAMIKLPEIDVQLPLAALYERVDWSEVDADAEEPA